MNTKYIVLSHKTNVAMLVTTNECAFWHKLDMLIWENDPAEADAPYSFIGDSEEALFDVLSVGAI